MSLINLFSNRAPQLSTALINSVQTTVRAVGAAQITLGGKHYTVQHVKVLDGFCVQSAGGGFLEKLFGNEKTEKNIACLEKQLNQNINPVKAYNEHINKILESRV